MVRIDCFPISVCLLVWLVLAIASIGCNSSSGSFFPAVLLSVDTPSTNLPRGYMLICFQMEMNQMERFTLTLVLQLILSACSTCWLEGLRPLVYTLSILSQSMYLFLMHIKYSEEDSIYCFFSVHKNERLTANRNSFCGSGGCCIEDITV